MSLIGSFGAELRGQERLSRLAMYAPSRPQGTTRSRPETSLRLAHPDYSRSTILSTP